jgi:hypothetical protein
MYVVFTLWCMLQLLIKQQLQRIVKHLHIDTDNHYFADMVKECATTKGDSNPTTTTTDDELNSVFIDVPRWVVLLHSQLYDSCTTSQ